MFCFPKRTSITSSTLTMKAKNRQGCADITPWADSELGYLRKLGDTAMYMMHDNLRLHGLFKIVSRPPWSNRYFRARLSVHTSVIISKCRQLPLHYLCSSAPVG